MHKSVLNEEGVDYDSEPSIIDELDPDPPQLPFVPDELVESEAQDLCSQISREGWPLDDVEDVSFILSNPKVQFIYLIKMIFLLLSRLSQSP